MKNNQTTTTNALNSETTHKVNTLEAFVANLHKGSLLHWFILLMICVILLELSVLCNVGPVLMQAEPKPTQIKEML